MLKIKCNFPKLWPPHAQNAVKIVAFIFPVIRQVRIAWVLQADSRYSARFQVSFAVQVCERQSSRTPRDHGDGRLKFS